jgi:hypothetical protein
MFSFTVRRLIGASAVVCLAASAVVVGSVAVPGQTLALPGTATGVPATGSATPTESKQWKSWPDGAKPVADATSSQLIDGGYVFVPINPYRNYDSRAYRNGRISSGEEIYGEVLTNESGEPQIPNYAVAVTYNLTVTNTDGPGFLGAFPSDIDWPGNSSVNWTGRGATVGNGGTTAIGFLDADGQMSVYMGGPPGGSTDFIIDITGFYQ